MTQKEAIIKVLQDLGGRARLVDIYPRVIELVYFKPDSDKQATIRTIMLRDSKHFRQTKKRSGYWELVSYQEDIAERDKKIEELTAEVERLRKVPTEDDFVKRFIEATKTQFKFRPQAADAVRQIMDKMGRNDAEAILGTWIEGKENKHAVAIGKVEIRQGGTNIGTNYGPNIENNGGILSLPDNDNKNG
jgi:hypothetical protein